MRRQPIKPRRKRLYTRKEALRLESDRALREMIRQLLDLPMHRRVWFLRVRHPNGGSHV